MVDLHSGKSTTPYTKAQEEQAATVLQERKEKEAKKELIKQAKKLALQVEQAAKRKKLGEEMERLKKEEEEKMKAVEEEEIEEEKEEEPLIRRSAGQRGESKKVFEWVANLSLGEEEEAMLYVPREEKEAVIRELEEEEDPLMRQTIEDEKKLQRKLRLTTEKKRRMDEVLEKLREANFKINAKKCEWAKTQVLYLGHVLDGDDIKPKDRKIAVIRDWPTPRTLTELRSFLGLANYYRKLANFSTIAAPLRRLLKKEAIWKWDKDCTSALKKLKRALIEYPVLKVADPSLPFVVTTDASQYGIGAVLHQDDGNGYRSVEFMPARMPSKKVATSTYERELYALRQALQHWKHYLLGRHFKVYSDHETLRWLKTQAKMTSKLTRWAATLYQYDFELKPVKGKYNVVADALRRRADYFGAIVHYLDIGRDLQQKIQRLPPGTREFSIQHEKEIGTAVDNLRKAQHRMIEQANKHRRPSQFQVGDLVWVKSKEFAPEENISQKLLPAYRGPWPVLEVKGGEDGPSYTIEIPAHLHMYPMYHASKLLPCSTSPQIPSRRSMIPPDMDGRYDIDGTVGSLNSRDITCASFVRMRQIGAQINTMVPTGETCFLEPLQVAEWKPGNARLTSPCYGSKLELMSMEQDTGALPRRSARLAVRARSVVPPRTKYQQQRISRRTTPAASNTTLTVLVPIGVLPACPVQGAHEPLADYLGRLQVFTDAVATAKAQQEAAEAERQRLANEAAAQAQQTAEADAAAQDRRNAASTESLIQSENQWTTLLQGMFFVPTGARAAATQQQQQQQLLNSTLARINNIEAKTSAAPGCTTDATKQLNERIDHVVTIIGELGDFTSPATISSTAAAIKTSITKLQTRLDAATKNYKMPHFDVSKFDDYNKSDALTWWQSFLTEASCRTVPADDMMKALYLQLIGGVQAWMNHLAATKKCTIAELHTHITWKEFEKLWFTRFMVRNVVKAAMNEVYTCSQGSMPTRDWTTKWQKIVTTPGFDLTRNDVEEMGLVFLHALPSPDGPAASPSDPRITHLLNEYGDVFEAPTGTVPDRPIRHGITLEVGAVPPRGCIYRMSEEELEVLRAQLDDLLDKGWIRPSCSPYGAPILFVRKKNKDLRLCINYRNAQTVKNVGPLPRIDDLLERLGGATYFSKLDLKSGYHQIEIQPQDRYKTAFKTRYGHFEWVVMPFGLTNAPATFQAAMTTEFRDLLDRSVLIYLDDILVYSRTLDEHIVHLRTVLDHLRLAKYKANSTSIRPLADKIQAIVDWPEPRCTTDVRSFMGLAGYYQRFVESYSKVAAPLSRLQSFEFDDAARGAFTTLKATMQVAPALRMYDPTLPTQVTTDASGYDIGAVLEQCHEDGWHPVEYFSQKVPLVNTLDDARKRELLAFVTVLKQWRHFLFGRRRVKWNTDNNPLTFYKTQDTVTSTIGRWMHYIDQFDFDPCHIPAPELARVLHTGWITSHGVQEDIVSDRDTRFMSAFSTSLMAESGTTMKPSSARHLQMDGQTERAHQTAQMMLRIRPDQKDWADRLLDIEFAYNTSVHPAICVTPFELHHGGEKARIFADLLLPQAANIDVPCSPASVRKYRDLLIKVRANMQKAQICMQQQANRRRLPCPFCEGDLVWVLSEEFALEQDVSRKLLPKWFGPWEVTSAVGDDPAGPSFVVNIPPHLTVHRVFHPSKLAIYTPPSADEFPGRRSQDPPSMDGHQEVDRVITHRKYGNKPMQFKVIFRQCAPDDTRWISSADLQTSSPLIFADYEKRRLAKEAARPTRPILVFGGLLSSCIALGLVASCSFTEVVQRRLLFLTMAITVPRRVSMRKSVLAGGVVAAVLLVIFVFLAFNSLSLSLQAKTVLQNGLSGTPGSGILEGDFISVHGSVVARRAADLANNRFVACTNWCKEANDRAHQCILQSGTSEDINAVNNSSPAAEDLLTASVEGYEELSARDVLQVTGSPNQQQQQQQMTDTGLQLGRAASAGVDPFCYGTANHSAWGKMDDRLTGSGSVQRFLYMMSLASQAVFGGRAKESSADPSQFANMNTADIELLEVASERANLAPKIAFMFLVRDSLTFAPLWEKIFHGHENQYSVYVHATEAYKRGPQESDVFEKSVICSKPVKWGRPSLVDAERRLIASAILDPLNQKFVLLSESCIPVRNFSFIYSYLMDTSKSFVEIGLFPDRYPPELAPLVKVEQFRKGSQWVTLNRVHAALVVADRVYYPPFMRWCQGFPRRFCIGFATKRRCWNFPNVLCFADEHYMQTMLHILDEGAVHPRTLTWLEWIWQSPHPRTRGAGDTDLALLKQIQNDATCEWNGLNRECFLFARKFSKDALPIILSLGKQLQLW
ncbi:hypothetical protein CBR_g17791 [Chara braunii]|uniref:Reverse transcriptase domain-containing protein n=1 Tax=Chara braunii TaxID=69332 RepID=A0A388KVI1_CHABU|nr:hypothetical protein CBR_g17791 [Chara braunii]|eukprot:GBG74080.1 hypothetical protein CBR_g17791 [Chara braunii]